VRTEVFFTLLDQVHSTKGSSIRHFLCLYILRREEKFLGIHQQHPMLARPRQHLLALSDGHRQWLLTDDVLAGLGTLDGHLRVKIIWCSDRDHLDVALLEHFPIVGEYGRNVVLSGERCCISGSGRRNRHDLGFFWSDFEGASMDIGFELE
jgi:hypothetical protein